MNLENLEFSQQIFLKNIQISNFMTICPVGTESFHADVQTDGQTYRHVESNSHFFAIC